MARLFFKPLKTNNMILEQAKQLAIDLMQYHTLTQQGWRFDFDNAKKRFGCCNYTRKTITLSKHLTAVNGLDAVRDTILHEIAHAIAGYKNGHNTTWQNIAISIGCNGKRCYNPTEVTTITGKLVAVCPGCNKTFYKHRKPKRNSSCGKCSGNKYNETYKLNFTSINN